MKKRSKLLVIILVLVMLFAMVASGCAKDEPEEKKEETKITETKTEEKKEEPAEPSVITYKSYTGPIEEDLDYSETTIGAFILEKFNAKLEIWPASETTYREELVTDAATNSLPDFLSIWVYPNAPEEILVLQKAAREGLLAGLNAAIDTHAPTIKAAINTTDNYPIYTQEYMADETFNGETYFLPCRYTVNMKTPPGWSFVMRDDVRAELGMSTDPIYMDDPETFLNILRDIKATDPVDINGNPAWATGGIRIWTVLIGAYHRPFDWGGVGGVDIDESGKLVHAFDTDYPWQQILFMRKLIDEKLMDPETLTHTFEVGKEKVGQGKYIVESFFAAGGTSFSYHKPTVAAKPEMSYSIMGSFYTNKGKDAPMLVNNIGMQTHFLNAVSANADLDVVMPIIEFFATGEGTATNAYGILGEQWNWEGDNAVISPDYVDAYLEESADIPHPYVAEHGTGPFNYLATIPGVNGPGQLVFGGTEKARYPLDPSRDDEIAKRIALAYGDGGLQTENKMTLTAFLQSYENKDNIKDLLDVSNMNANLYFPAYLADSEADAKELYDKYVASVKDVGLDAYIKYLQDIYDADPDRYLLYESLGG